MRITAYLNLKHFFLVPLILGATLLAEAQYAKPTAGANKVRTMRLDIDGPMEIVYEDGRVAQVVRRESIDAFRVPIMLSDNSCQNVSGLKCTLVVPFIRQQYAAIWKSHPTRQGLPLEYSFRKDMTYGNQVAITRSQNELYETILRRIPSNGIEREKIIAAQNNKSLGQIECAQDVTSALPAQKEILFWDENYENGNSELAMTEGPVFGARVNLIYRRFQGLMTDAQGKVIRIGRFKKAYGLAADDYPIGLSYMVQMLFRANNLHEPADEVCRMKWDVNFSEYFIQTSGLMINGGREAYNSSGFLIYKYNLENPTNDSQRIYKKDLWEQEGMQ